MILKTSPLKRMHRQAKNFGWKDGLGKMYGRMIQRVCEMNQKIFDRNWTLGKRREIKKTTLGVGDGSGACLSSVFEELMFDLVKPWRSTSGGPKNGFSWVMICTVNPNSKKSIDYSINFCKKDPQPLQYVANATFLAVLYNDLLCAWGSGTQNM
ncbi:hypothetical protein YC2023_118517 [Brassica napus]